MSNTGDRGTPRAVLDTNVLFGSAWAAGSASRRIVDACLRGEVIVLLSPALKREYNLILKRTARSSAYYDELQTLLDRAELVEPAATPRVVPDDPDDDKLVALVLAGPADAVITSDRHLLELRSYRGVPIVTPSAFVREWLEPREGPV